MKVSPAVWTSALMVAGNPAVDLVNTLSNAGADATDRLGGAEAFAKWAHVAGLADHAALDGMLDEMRRDPRGAARLYARASALRDALVRGFSRIAKGEPAAEADLAEIAGWVVRGADASVIEAFDGGYRRAFKPETPELEKPIIEIARAAEKLLLEGDLHRLHVCAGHGCGWMFVDSSKNGKRRWCSMATCGTAAKVKKFRQRKKVPAGMRSRRNS